MIKTGDTFRAIYADSNSLWRVVKKKSKDVYLCEIVNESFEHDGKVFSGDYNGIQKVFLAEEIIRAISHESFSKKRKQDCGNYYSSLNEDQIVHYYNGFNQYVRCRVNSKKELVPFALVGDWRENDLPRRLSDGTVHLPYYIDCIVNKKPFKPNAANIFEYQGFSNKNFDPTNKKEIDISVSEQTEEEKKISRFWVTINQIQKEVSIIDRDPVVILSKIKDIISRSEKND